MVRFYETHYRPSYVLARRPFFDWSFRSPFQARARYGQQLLLDGDRIVGILGSLPWPMQIDGRRDLGQYVVNLLLDPAYRGQGLGQLLVETVCAGSRCTVASGYNEATLPMYERLGRVHHWRLRRYVRTLDAQTTEDLLRASPRFTALGDVARRRTVEGVRQSAATSPAPPGPDCQRVERFGGEWDDAWEAMRKGYGFTTWRGADFLNWRYIDYPFPLYQCYTLRAEGRITGLLVVRAESAPFGTVLRIIDLVGVRGVRAQLLSTAASLAASQGAVFVDFLSRGGVDDMELAAAGFGEPCDETTSATLLPMDFNPIRHRNDILLLVLFPDRDDPSSAEIERGSYYFVKGDGDQDRAN
jgi:GNAT superfamily N-acetyltransferase